jgi:hypothetical protein
MIGRRHSAGWARRIRAASRALSVGLMVTLLSACAPPTGSESATARASAPPKTEHPDLSGHYDLATLTPLQRPKEYGDNLYLTPEEADAIAQTEADLTALRDQNRGPATQAPPVGGAPPIGLGDEAREQSGAGAVGGYNNAYVDRGSDVVMIDGKFRTSILTSPQSGRIPDMTPEAMAMAMERRKFYRPNTGEAWWVAMDGPGPYDGPESLSDSERCLTGFGSTGGPPMLPVLYNNMKRIVQTDDHVMIQVEMVHDARIIRLNSEHLPAEVRHWYGDSIGWWEGDTLIVETTNFNDSPALFSATRDLQVVERFRQADNGDLLYSFMVTDPNVWTQSWGGEYLWRDSDQLVYEYACHEGNYSMEGMLRGARLLEREAMASSADG